MFEREICRHPDVAHVHYTPHTYNETHYWVKAACILPTTPDAGFSNGIRPHSYGSRATTRKSLLKTIQGNVADFKVSDNDEQLVFEGWDALCHEFARPVFFEKSPHHAHHPAALELIMKWAKTTNHKVRVIGLVRNPMAVMYSALQLFHTDPGQRQFGWVHANRNILKLAEQLEQDQFKLIRYEDLVKDAVTRFREVCDFIGIAHQDQAGESVNARSLDKWRDDPLFDFQLDQTVASYARELGYDDTDLYNPPKPEASYFSQIRRDTFLKFKRVQSRIYNKIKRLTD